MNLRASNSYFEHENYVTHTSFLTPDSPQMLDLFSLSISLYKRIRGSKVSELGIPSNHAAVELLVAVSSIKVEREKKSPK